MAGVQDSVAMIRSNLEIVWEKMAQAAIRAQRPIRDIKLIVVTKGRSIDISRAAIKAGLMDFGENYPEAAFDKIIATKELPGIRWHMIGHLQS